MTGGYSQIAQFDERLRREMTSVLPVGSPVSIKRAQHPQLDAWRGLAKFASSSEGKAAMITRAEYLEKGGEYLKEHSLSNSYELL